MTVLRIVSGSATPGLASALANYLGVESDGCSRERFPDGALRPTVENSCGADVYAIQAVRWDAREATMRSIGLTVVHVSEPPAVWPAAPLPAVIYRRHEEGARKIVADAIKVAEDSLQEGNRAEIDSELPVISVGVG